MKRRLFLTLVMVIVIALTFALVVFADDTFTHNGKVDLKATVTLDDGTVCNLFDAEGNALIWYKNGSTLESIRADDERVIYKCTYAFGVGNSTVGSVTAYEVSDMWIALDSGNVSKGNIVVLNLMDDDVLINNNRDIGQPVNCLKTIAWANKVLEYAFCRLDTVAIQQQTFNGCPKLKYINLEDLTELRQIGGSQPFGQTAGETALFAGEVLDLTGTKLCAISGNGAFNNVPAVEIKLPNTVTTLSDWNIQGTAITTFTFPTGVATITGSQFNDCKSLTTIYINSTTTKISGRAFNNTKLEKVFFVGTLGQLNTLFDNTDFTDNSPLEAAFGENKANVISYADYLALNDKSGKYVVYGYSYCEAYAEGVHTIEGSTDCTIGGTCTICNALSEGFDAHDIVNTLVYANGFDNAGVYNCYCTREGCLAVGDVNNDGVADEYAKDKQVSAIITFKGYSRALSNAYLGIDAGYKVDKDLLALYNEVNTTDATLSLFMVNSKYGEVNISKIFKDGTLDLETNVKGINVSITSTNYTDISVSVKGFDNADEEGSFYTLALISAIAVKTEAGVHYIQAGLKNSPNTTITVDGVDFNIVTANNVYNPTVA